MLRYRRWGGLPLAMARPNPRAPVHMHEHERRCRVMADDGG